MTPLFQATNLAGERLSWMYWSGRAGTLAVAQFPLITALGTKNNVLACELYTAVSRALHFDVQMHRHYWCEL